MKIVWTETESQVLQRGQNGRWCFIIQRPYDHWLFLPRSIALHAVENGEEVGRLIMHMPTKSVLAVDGILVAKRFRRKGFARRLLRRAVKELKPNEVTMQYVSRDGRGFSKAAVGFLRRSHVKVTVSDFTKKKGGKA